MLRSCIQHATTVFFAFICFVPLLEAQITQLTNPSQYQGSITQIDFDNAASGSLATNLFLSDGVVFTRDDGFDPVIISPTNLATSSPANAIGTIGLPPTGFTNHLNVVFTQPTLEVGAFFGNDQFASFTQMTLSIFDSAGLIGSVNLADNNNDDVDQFLGVQSTVPFTMARFEHDAVDLAVVIDDLGFTSVPEPSSATLLVLISFCCFSIHRRRQSS